jgi:hypothetical protein
MVDHLLVSRKERIIVVETKCSLIHLVKWSSVYSPVGGMLNAGGRSLSGSAQVTVSGRRNLTAADRRNAATAGLQEPRASTRGEAGAGRTGDPLTAAV